MKEIFKKGLFLIIIALFLFSDFGDDFKAIGNIFLIKAEEISEVEEILKMILSKKQCIPYI